MSTAPDTDSRTALLGAAERLLIEQGHAALTVRVVATEAGVNHGLVRYYFTNLNNLLLEAFDRYTNQLSSASAPSMHRTSPSSRNGEPR